jgi:dephospho-CoA kinase
MITKKPLYKTAITGSRKVGLSLVGDFLKRHQRVAVIDLEAIPPELFAGPQFTDIDEWTGQTVVTTNATHAALRQEFGSDLVDMINGPINRDKLAARINGNPGRMRKYNSIMHQGIRNRMTQKLDLVKAAIAFVLVPFLFEHKMRDQFNEAWCVICQHSIQIQRIMNVEGVTAQEAQVLIDKHWTQVTKARKSNYVINNSGDPANTYAQILGLLPQALKRARAFSRAQAPPSTPSTSSAA